MTNAASGAAGTSEYAEPSLDGKESAAIEPARSPHDDASTPTAAPSAQSGGDSVHSHEAHVDAEHVDAELSHGPADSFHAFLARLWNEVRTLAALQMQRERDPLSVTPTDVVSELWYRGRELDAAFESDAAFLAYASRAVRNTVIDYLRRRAARRRHLAAFAEQRQRQHGPERSDYFAGTDADRLLELEEELEALEKVDPRPVAAFRLRYYGGLTHCQIAEAVGVSERTVQKDLRELRAWLAVRLGYTADEQE